MFVVFVFLLSEERAGHHEVLQPLSPAVLLSVAVVANVFRGDVVVRGGSVSSDFGVEPSPYDEVRPCSLALIVDAVGVRRASVGLTRLQSTSLRLFISTLLTLGPLC